MRDATLAAVRRRTNPYPQLSVGDFLARLFHDWDNTRGLRIDGGDVVFGDGHVHEGATRRLAVAAARAGIDDVEGAIELGEAGRRLTGQPLYRAVRAATGAEGGSFRPESSIPSPSELNPPQNWRAPDLESLWRAPIVGSSGTTVGEALTEMMHPDGYLIRQLDRLGQGLVDAHGLRAVRPRENAPPPGLCPRSRGRKTKAPGRIIPLSPSRRIIIPLRGSEASAPILAVRR